MIPFFIQGLWQTIHVKIELYSVTAILYIICQCVGYLSRKNINVET